MSEQIVTSPIITDETGQDILAAIENLADAVKPNAQGVSFDKTGCKVITTTNVQDGMKQLDSGLDTVSSNLTHIAVLTTPLEINYADSNSIGYRTTETTKVDITQLTGYPTGKTYIGAVAQAIDNWGAIVSVDNEKYLRGARKTSSTITVIVYVFYKD